MPPRVFPDLHSFFRNNPDESLMAVAKDVGCSMPHLSMIKWGTRQPTLPLALKIARRCHVPLKSLLLKEHRIGA